MGQIKNIKLHIVTDIKSQKWQIRMFIFVSRRWLYWSTCCRSLCTGTMSQKTIAVNTPPLTTGRKRKRREAEPTFHRHETPPQMEKTDWVSQPDKESNIRKIIYAKKNNNELLSKQRDEMYEWNHDFWKHHNNKFYAEKKFFIDDTNAASGRPMDVSDNLSTFYKDFLDKNHDTYMSYGRELYKRNLKLLWTSFCAPFLTFFQKKKSK